MDIFNSSTNETSHVKMYNITYTPVTMATNESWSFLKLLSIEPSHEGQYMCRAEYLDVQMCQETFNVMVKMGKKKSDAVDHAFFCDFSLCNKTRLSK